MFYNITYTNKRSYATLMTDNVKPNCNSLAHYRVSTTPGNLLEFVWSSWKFLCKVSMIDLISFQSW